jgi:flavin-binding protein dodecin
MKEFETIEIVGISDKSYSDAVKQVLKTVKKQVHWFEFVDIWGRMTKDKNIEFQLILKIGCS